jgi:hypothetical protein
VSFAPHLTKISMAAADFRLTPRLRPTAARVAHFNVPELGALRMSLCYLRGENDIDVERCRISIREKSAVTLFALDNAGHVSCWTGVVQSIEFDPTRAVDKRWRVEMDLCQSRHPTSDDFRSR